MKNLVGKTAKQACKPQQAAMLEFFSFKDLLKRPYVCIGFLRG